MNDKPFIKVERMYLLEGEGAVKAFCDISILESFLVKGLRVVQGKDSLFVGMPQERGRDEKWYSTFRPLSQEMRKAIEEVVLEGFTEKQASPGK